MRSIFKVAAAAAVVALAVTLGVTVVQIKGTAATKAAHLAAEFTGQSVTSNDALPAQSSQKSTTQITTTEHWRQYLTTCISPDARWLPPGSQYC